MKSFKIITSILLLVIALMVLAACTTDTPEPTTPEITVTVVTEPPTPTEAPGNDTTSDPADYEPAISSTYIYNRAGVQIALPSQINTIISIGPAPTEILVALGFANNIISTDFFSGTVAGLQPGISVLDMFALDLEHILALEPDVIFATEMIHIPGTDDPLGLVADLGISVIYVPVSTSIEAIKDDIRFIAAITQTDTTGEAIITQMTAEIASIREIAETITTRRTVYFEISPPPHMVSFGHGTFLHEMIEAVGAVNVFADLASWTPIADEVLLEVNPEIILTSVDFIDDPIGDILNRPGWDTIDAVTNSNVFAIDADSSSRPTHNIVYAMWEIARAVYPEYF